MEEIWSTIPEHSRYEASNLGRIRDTETGNILNQYLQSASNGYYSVKLSLGTRKPNGIIERVCKNVHRLVLEAFIGPRPDGMIIRHLDGTRTNNRLDNLCYGTPAENTQDAIILGSIKRKIEEDQIDNLQRKYLSGSSTWQLSEEYQVTQTVIRKCLFGEVKCSRELNTDLIEQCKTEAYKRKHDKSYCNTLFPPSNDTRFKKKS